MKNADMPAIPVYLDRASWKLRWSKDIGTAKADDEAGSEIGRGYRQIKYKGKRYLSHRVIFFLENGFLPEQVDHIDGDTSNNDPKNLRAATHSQNMINRKTQENNTSGNRGVDFMKRTKKWRAQIHKDGRKIYLGLFDKIEDAIKARVKAEKEMHREYSRK